jgi:Tfp pilus assembly protein PilF
MSAKYVTGGSDAGADDFYELAGMAYGEGDVALAERSMRKATHLAPWRADLHSALGIVEYERGKFTQARRSFEAALNQTSAPEEALLGMALSLHTMNKESDAIYYYLSYLAKRPDNVSSMINLGAAYQSTGQIDEAIEMFERACEIEPENPVVHGAYGRSLYELGRSDEAIIRLRRAIDLGSTDIELYRALSVALITQDEFDDARAQLERAVEIDPEHLAARMDLARLLTEAGELEEGLQHARIGVEIVKKEKRSDEEAAWAFGQLGWAHYTVREWSQAADASRKALEIEADLVPARFNLGLALLRAGDVENARHEYTMAVDAVDDAWDLKMNGINDLKSALSDDPDFAGGNEILEMLEARYHDLSARRTPVSSD